MHDYYKIPSYERCLKIVEGCEAFSRSVQEIHGKKVESFKYNLVMDGMWDGEGCINMRGITFVDGQLVALPFPKFFNLGEHATTQNIDMTKAFSFYEKIDGSLITFFKIGDKIELKSMKSVESDVANEAREYLKTRPDVLGFVEELIGSGLTPLFEYVSPTQKIVLNYKQDLVFLASRSLKTGTMRFSDPTIPDTITTPKQFSFKTLKAYLDRTDVEGVVGMSEDGVMFKVKTDTYCKIHKILSYFSPKNIVANIIEGTFDDMMGVLTFNNLDEDAQKAKDIFKKYTERYKDWKSRAEAYYKENINKDRKTIAMDLVPKDKALSGLVFKLIDGKDLTEMINKYILNESKEWIFG